MMNNIISITYLIAACLFILSLQGLSGPKSARMGNLFGMIGMLLASVATIMMPSMQHHFLILLAIAMGASIGIYLAIKIEITSMPQLVAAFHSLVGMAAVLIATAAYLSPEEFGILLADKTIAKASLIEMSIGALVGAITFSGSIVAFAKLQGLVSGKPVRFMGLQLLNLLMFLVAIYYIYSFCLLDNGYKLAAIILLSIVLGVTLVLPIGGADMPVIVSLLNSYSGWAASGIGFTLNNSLLIITGALVGASGAILSYIMCKAMNRSIINVIFGSFSKAENTVGIDDEDKIYKTASPEDVAFLMENARNVIIVPGYGMAVAQAQHAVKELVTKLKSKGVNVKFAIHPVAGRMPGHMNVLLAEASIGYEDVFELEEINNDFRDCDVTYVIGANDITNPAAKNDPSSPIYGMPILDVASSKNVIFVKRSMAAGYAGIDNSIFYAVNTSMLLGDAKKVTEEVVKHL
jgi:NAD(P) transhydrogenase subunit beta